MGLKDAQPTANLHCALAKNEIEAITQLRAAYDLALRRRWCDRVGPVGLLLPSSARRGPIVQARMVSRLKTAHI